MKHRIAPLALAAAFGLALAGGPAMASAPPAASATDAIRPLNDAEKAGAGCLASAATAMTVTYATAPTEMILLVVGGLVVPSNSSILFLSLFSTVAAASCAVGSSLTPLVLGTVDRWSH